MSPCERWRIEVGGCLRLAVPLIVGQVGLIGMEVADIAMAGHLGGLALAAVGLGVSLAMPVMIFFMGVCMAVSPIVAYHVGARETEKIAPYMAQTLWLAGLLGIAWWLLYQTAPWIIGWLNVEPDLQRLAVDYVKAMAWGAPGGCLMFVLRFMFEGMGRARPVMVVGLLGLVINVAANYVFMYGMFGIPAMGAVGAGYGTALTLWAMAAVMAVMTRWVPLVHHLKLRAALGRPRPKAWPQTLRLGIPVGVTLFLEGGLFGMLGLLMALFSPTAVAAYQVAANFAGLSFMLPLGISLATTARVGQAAGAGDMEEARFRGFVGVALAMVIMILPLTAMGVFPRWIAGFYTADPEILMLAAGLLQLAVLFQLFDGLQASSAGALRGCKDTRVPMVITLVAYWGVGLPVGWWLGFVHNGGPQGLWWALIAGLGVAAVLLIWRFQAVTRRAIENGSQFAHNPR